MPASNTHPNKASKAFLNFILSSFPQSSILPVGLLRPMMMVSVMMTRGGVGRHSHRSKQGNGEHS